MGSRTVLLAGGVGGAKMAEGLAGVTGPAGLAVIGNVADDAEFHDLWVSPDIDTVTYTLADTIDRDRGWGLRGDTFHTLGMLAQLGAETWMQLGDRDLAIHIYRSQQRRAGRRPSEIAAEIARRLGVAVEILLPTDDPVQTRVRTAAGWLGFQDYFVREQCRPDVLAIEFAGAAAARPTAAALAAIDAASLIVVAPSNPLVSIAPILAIPGIAKALQSSAAPTIAISPIVGGRTIKGPADRMLRAAGYPADPLGVAAVYGDLLDGMVIDTRDATAATELEALGLRVCIADTVMTDGPSRAALAGAILEFGKSCPSQRARS